MHFNVCYIDTDELELMLEDKLAAKNAVPAEPLAELLAELKANVEDFVSHSR